jgi:large subunit ribosomal protein L22
MEEARAVARHVRIAPRKVRVVMDLIRGKSVDEALAILRYTPKVASEILEKVVKSAAANATHNYEMNHDDLYISEAFVDVGPTLKRFQPRQRGQAFSIKKRTSHVTVVVSQRNEGKGEGVEKPRGRRFFRRPGVRRAQPPKPAETEAVKEEPSAETAAGAPKKAAKPAAKGKTAAKPATKASAKKAPAKKAAPGTKAPAKPKAEKKAEKKTGRQGKGE